MSNAKPIKTVIAVAGHRPDPPVHMNLLDDRFIYVNNMELEFPDTPEGRLLNSPPIVGEGKGWGQYSGWLYMVGLRPRN